MMGSGKRRVNFFRMEFLSYSSIYDPVSMDTQAALNVVQFFGLFIFEIII